MPSRVDGVCRHAIPTGRYNSALRDHSCRGAPWQPALQTTRCPVDVLVVGAGITGIYQLFRAREAGFSAQLLEAGSGVGGTWFWNRYPGARFDSESYTYGYLFSQELWDEWEWQEHFAEQPEIERYLNHVVDRFDLRRHMHFDARVTSAVYDEPSSTWTVTTDDGARVSRALPDQLDGHPVGAVLPGRRRARRTSAASSSTPGSGRRRRSTSRASGSRSSAPDPAGSSWSRSPPQQAASLTVYQRSANWCTPLNNAPITPEEQARLRAEFESIRETLNTSPAGFLHLPHDRATFDDSRGGAARVLREDVEQPRIQQAHQQLHGSAVRRGGQRAVDRVPRREDPRHRADPDTASKLIPKTPLRRAPAAVRDRLLRDLQPAQRLARRPHRHPDGARDRERASRRPRGYASSTSSCGRPASTSARARCGAWGSAAAAGWRSRTHWADGPKTFLGVQTSEFPNFFFPGGPHAAAGNNPRYNGDQVDFITGLLGYARDHGYDTIEVDPAAEDDWTAMIDRGAKRRPVVRREQLLLRRQHPGQAAQVSAQLRRPPETAASDGRMDQNDYKSFRFS